MMKKIVLFFTVMVMVAFVSQDVLARGGDRGGGGRGGGDRGGSGFRPGPGPGAARSQPGPSRSYQRPSGPSRSYQRPSGPSRSYGKPSGPSRSMKGRPYGPPTMKGKPAWNRPGRGSFPPPKPRGGPGAMSRYSHRPHPRPYPHHHHRHHYPGWRPGWWSLPVAWGMGSAWWNWNTGPYYNPYAVYIQDPAYNYSEPIYPYSDEAATAENEALAASDAESEKEALAMRYFQTARDAFKATDYIKALEDVNRSIRLLPRDAAMHEFRALALFAIGKYNQAAAVANSVLASGPGWDWDTMIGLYENPEEYTHQLRGLETFVKEHEKDAAAKFLLAYQYLVMGFDENAKAELAEVVRLQPKDILAQRLLAMLSKSPKETEDAATPAPAPTPPTPQ